MFNLLKTVFYYISSLYRTKRTPCISYLQGFRIAVGATIQKYVYNIIIIIALPPLSRHSVQNLIRTPVSQTKLIIIRDPLYTRPSVEIRPFRDSFFILLWKLDYTRKTATFLSTINILSTAVIWLQKANTCLYVQRKKIHKKN